MAQNRSGGARKSAAKPAQPEVRILSIDEIEQVDDLPEKIVAIPEWGEGVGVKIKALTKQQQIDIRKQATVNGTVDADEADLLAIVTSVVEPELTREQVGVLKTKNANAIDRISVELAQLNGMDKEALDALEAAFRALTG